MKVLVIGFTKISYMPYMHFYIDQLRKHDCEIHLLYWKRDNSPDADIHKDIVTYRFDQYQEDSVPLFRKLGSFLKYRRYALKILREHKFDLVVVLHSTPGVLLFDVLTKKYRNNYILDYRDFTYENFKFYKKIIHKLAINSCATFVSSDAYRKYLPSIDKLYTSHNILVNSLEKREVRKSKNRNTYPIRIGFWGFIRHENINITIIDKLANDKRFELHYHGREQKSGQILKSHCEENRYRNIFFHGEYKLNDRYKFLEDIDLAHNIYENDIKTTNAMGNKYYDGITFYIPQICNQGSFMGEQVSDNKVGISIDPHSLNFADEIEKYYKSIDWEYFETSCDKTLNNVIEQYNKGIYTIDKIIKEKHKM